MEDDGGMKRQMHRKQELFGQGVEADGQRKEMERTRERKEEDETKVTICIIQTH